MHAHRRAALAAAAAIGLWSTMVPAWADGMPRSSRPDPYAYTPAGIALDYDWTGIYFGGHAGGAISDWNWNAANPFEPVSQKDTGFAGGAQIGVQKQWDWIVVGAEVSYTWADLKGSKPSELVVGTSLTSEANNLLLVTARLGFAWQHVLAYVKGGYASVDVAFSSFGASASKRADGSVAGLGLEFGLTPHITIGAEYDWLKVNAAAPGALDAGVDIQTLTARLNFKFGPRAGVVPYR
jgi:outer membrane immunogenic protein